MDRKYQKTTKKSNDKLKKWLPKIIRVNGIFGGETPELITSKASQEGNELQLLKLLKKKAILPLEALDTNMQQSEKLKMY